MKRLLILVCLLTLPSTGEATSAVPVPRKPKPKLEFEGLPKKHLMINKEVTFRLIATHVDLKDVVVQVVYRPGSKVAVTDDLKLPADGVLKWTPRHEGLVLIKAMKYKQDKKGKVLKDKNGEPIGELEGKIPCAVKFEGVPILGVVIFVIAFLSLFGGLGYAVIRGS